MKDNIMFLLEEKSMKILLEILLSDLYGEKPCQSIKYRFYRGKGELKEKFPSVVRSLDYSKFIIMIDKDKSDCKELKRSIKNACSRENKTADVLVRIVCHELESWYLGSPQALGKAFGEKHAKKIRNKSKYRDPDSRPKPSADLERLIPQFQKVSGARKIAPYLSRENTSKSFQTFLGSMDCLLGKPKQIVSG